MFERLQRILSQEEFERISNLNILLIGVGGVGGYTLEALIRSGIKRITIIDYDTFEITNMNRQILCTKETLLKSKVEAAKARAKLINETALINGINKKITKDDINPEFLKQFDAIIDACDDVEVKVKLIEECSNNSMNLISCMGTGNRFNPAMLETTKLGKTKNDPLSRKIRHKLKDNHKALNTTVLCSKEIPIKGKGLGTFCAVPMAAGAYLAAYAIKKEN